MTDGILRSEQLSRDKTIFSRQTFCRIFHETALRYPDRIAVMDAEHSLTYRELDEYSNDLAVCLIHHGVKHGEIVSIESGRSIYSILAMLSLWKAGAACFYIDTCYPETESSRLRERCHCRLAIRRDFFAAHRFVPNAEFIDHSTADGLAVIIFTSGSTTEPKGVLLEQRNINASISNFDRLGLTSDDRICVFASFSFVAALFDICSGLASGARLCIIPEKSRRKIDSIVDYWNREKITVSFLPPHMAMKLMKVEDSRIPLRALLVGSERVRNLEKKPYRILNLYASTELAALISVYEISGAAGDYPIGRVNPTLRSYVVDDQGTPVPDGEIGELWLAGPQVSRGYFQNPELTARQYIRNPFGENPPYDRLFKTRDLVQRLPDGNLYYVGRKDTMYKIRGFRVEAAAVENALLSLGLVRETVVKIFTDHGGTNILCAYFTADKPLDVKLLKKKMRTLVPYYMVPTCMIQLAEFQRLRSGKVNRSAIEPPRELNDHKLLEKLY
jgi:amino acid adenylation domain-containing protein